MFYFIKISRKRTNTYTKLKYNEVYRLKKTFLLPTLWLWWFCSWWLSNIIRFKLACWWNSCRIEMCLLIFLNRICHNALSLFFHNKSAVFSLILRIFSSSLLAFISICMRERVVFVNRRYRYSFLLVFFGSETVSFIIDSYSVVLSYSLILSRKSCLFLARKRIPARSTAIANDRSMNSFVWL